ncbi:CHAD domain-containing protein [Pseudonocardia sediminis]|uniref:CHAD domain-containing protein n=1 Tax=Pseudonocardia sediminis TaxID=1397368 RepID=A0A4Q7UVG2_PSEST|nr:CHAD domain-containing protein [Pseudonocardia sediminis]RZT84063.1 CHAD domain-containing protein [Pseudonocardia sediminis]
MTTSSPVTSDAPGDTPTSDDAPDAQHGSQNGLLRLEELPDPITADPGAPAVHHVRVLLDKRLRSLLLHDPGTRAGVDIEDLHQMRVSVRRMRAALKAARTLLDAQWADALRAELGWLGRALGPVRDLDVMIARLRGEITELPAAERAAGDRLVAHLEEERGTARIAMIAALDDERYATLLRRLEAVVRDPLPEPEEGLARPELIDLVRAEARKLDKAVRRAGEDPPDMTLHDLRIRTKRLRYTGELVEPAMRDEKGRRTKSANRIRKTLAASAELQEVLGDHQDACVAEHRIRRLLDDLGDAPDAHVVFVGGRLVERERARAEELRRQWWAAWQTLNERAGSL